MLIHNVHQLGHSGSRSPAIPMSTPELVTLLDRRVVGVVQQTPRGQLRFTYDEARRESRIL